MEKDTRQTEVKLARREHRENCALLLTAILLAVLGTVWILLALLPDSHQGSHHIDSGEPALTEAEMDRQADQWLSDIDTELKNDEQRYNDEHHIVILDGTPNEGKP